MAIAKAFPLFTQKTSKDGTFKLEEVSVEIVTSDNKVFLNSLLSIFSEASKQGY